MTEPNGNVATVPPAPELEIPPLKHYQILRYSAWAASKPDSTIERTDVWAHSMVAMDDRGELLAFNKFEWSTIGPLRIIYYTCALIRDWYEVRVVEDSPTVN